MVTAYLALGANQGDRLAALQGARRALQETDGIRVEGSSALYETEPVGGPQGQGLYLNAVVEVRTDRSASDLLHVALEIEEGFGRRRNVRWGARTLDIDLLFYGEAVIEEPMLQIPHPRLHLRPFVLFPLCDLAPDLMHPVLRRSVRDLARDFSRSEGIRLQASSW